MQIWQLQDAKARLSELIRIVQKEPVTISVHGNETAIVLSKQDFDRLKPKPSLGMFLDKSPLKGMDINFERDSSLPRDTEI